MGTWVDLKLEGLPSDVQPRVAQEAIRVMQCLADAMSRFHPGSLVSQINRSAGVSPVEVSPEVMAVLQQAQRVSRQSAGAFDVTVGTFNGWSFQAGTGSLPSAAEIARQRDVLGYHQLHLDPTQRTAFLQHRDVRMDLGGIAKLFILEQGLRHVRQRGATRALINGGGDVLAFGGSPEAPWRIGVRDPLRPEQIAGVVPLQDGVIASSGDYERYFMVGQRRYHHILNPRTGYPTEGLHGVTLVARDVAQVNGWGAAIMVMGAGAGQRWVDQAPGVEGFMADRQGRTWLSQNMPWQAV